MLLIMSVIASILILFIIYNYIIVPKYNNYIFAENSAMNYCTIDSDCEVKNYLTSETFSSHHRCFNINEQPKDYWYFYSFNPRNIQTMQIIGPFLGCKCVNQICVDCHKEDCSY